MKTIKIFGEIGYDVTAESIIEKIDNSDGDISILIDSPGGAVFEGISIFNSIKKYSKGRIVVTINSICASISSYIALAADEIHIYANSSYMIHNAKTGSYGDSKTFEDMSKTLRGVTNILIDVYVEKTGMARDALEALMDAETYFFGEEILDAGFADKLLQNGIEAKLEEMSIAAHKKVKTCKENCRKRPDMDMQKVAALLLKKRSAMADEATKMMRKYKK